MSEVRPKLKMHCPIEKGKLPCNWWKTWKKKVTLLSTKTTLFGSIGRAKKLYQGWGTRATRRLLTCLQVTWTEKKEMLRNSSLEMLKRKWRESDTEASTLDGVVLDTALLLVMLYGISCYVEYWENAAKITVKTGILLAACYPQILLSVKNGDLIGSILSANTVISEKQGSYW